MSNDFVEPWHFVTHAGYFLIVLGTPTVSSIWFYIKAKVK
jgi:hypothetical protein